MAKRTAFTFQRVLIAAIGIFALFYFLRGSGTLKAKNVANHSTGGHPAKPYIPIDANQRQSQTSFGDIASKPLRTQLEFFFPYYAEDKFPAYIWQTWKHSPASGEFKDEYRAYEGSWSEMHPGFVHEVITDQSAVYLLQHLYSGIPLVLEAYHALPLPILKADFFRYLILLARGGIYTDIDTSAIKSALDWVPPDVPRESYGLVIGIEADPDREDWEQWYSRRIQFCQWTIQAKPGHPILREIVARVTEETLRRRDTSDFQNLDTHKVVGFTGPAIWTDTVFDYFNDPEYFNMEKSTENVTWKQFTGIRDAKKVGDVVVLPITCFSPGVGQMNAGEDDDPMAFVKHRFEGSWKPESERHIGENEPEKEPSNTEQQQTHQQREEPSQPQTQDKVEEPVQKQEQQQEDASHQSQGDAPEIVQDQEKQKKDVTEQEQEQIQGATKEQAQEAAKEQVQEQVENEAQEPSKEQTQELAQEEEHEQSLERELEDEYTQPKGEEVDDNTTKDQDQDQAQPVKEDEAEQHAEV